MPYHYTYCTIPYPQAIKASFKCKSVVTAAQYNNHPPGVMAGSGDDAGACLLNSEPMLLSCAGELCWCVVLVRCAGVLCWCVVLVRCAGVLCW